MRRNRAAAYRMGDNRTAATIRATILPEMTSPPDDQTHDRLQAAAWIAVGLGVLALLYVLSPILTPFLLAGILSYITNPIADRLEKLGLPRIVAVLAVILALCAGVVGLVLIILPLVTSEVASAISRMPEAVGLLNDKVAPWLQETFGIRLHLDTASLKKYASGNWDTIQAVLAKLYNSLKIGGVAVVGLVVNLMLAPVVMFYLLLDWHNLERRLAGVAPRPWQANIDRIAGDIDAVLSQYLRGQILVMGILAAYYTVALWIAGISSAFSIGVVTGLLIFIPYLGFATGLTLALLVALLQFAGWPPILAVLVIYGIGQVLESFLLTPYLVGERIGLHPLAVIFALMAFGQLFGFFGILAALPASAALLVALREVRGLYMASRFYLGQG